jgi:uncharacterized membrane protein YhiD involved in acid resistance
MDVVGVPDAADILTWPQAVFGAVVVLAALVVPQLLTYLQGRSTKEKVEAVKHQTENNSGSTLKDAVDRIERLLTEHITEASATDQANEARFERLERRRRPWRLHH